MNRRSLTLCCVLALGAANAVTAEPLAPPPVQGSSVPEPLCEDGGRSPRQ